MGEQEEDLVLYVGKGIVSKVPRMGIRPCSRGYDGEYSLLGISSRNNLLTVSVSRIRKVTKPAEVLGHVLIELALGVFIYRPLPAVEAAILLNAGPYKEKLQTLFKNMKVEGDEL